MTHTHTYWVESNQSKPLKSESEITTGIEIEIREREGCVCKAAQAGQVGQTAPAAVNTSRSIGACLNCCEIT